MYRTAESCVVTVCYPSRDIPQFCYIKVGFEGDISRTCFHKETATIALGPGYKFSLSFNLHIVCSTFN